MVTRVCEGCGVEFTRKLGKRNVGRFCSRACAFGHGAVGGWNRGRRLNLPETPFPICVVCFGVCPRRGMRTCSRTCRMEHVRVSARQASQAKKLIRTRACKGCGESFTAEYGNKKRVFCGELCSKRWARRQCGGGSTEQRARRAGVPCDYSIRPLQVCARDGWRCQLCGCSTPRYLRGTTNSRAPEVDHIVPLSAGGGHTWDNVQCACRKCNSDKGAKPLGQLRLIA